MKTNGISTDRTLPAPSGEAMVFTKPDPATSQPAGGGRAARQAADTYHLLVNPATRCPQHFSGVGAYLYTVSVKYRQQSPRAVEEKGGVKGSRRVSSRHVVMPVRWVWTGWWNQRLILVEPKENKKESLMERREIGPDGLRA